MTHEQEDERVSVRPLHDEIEASHRDVLAKMRRSESRSVFIERAHGIDMRARRTRQAASLVAALCVCGIGLGSLYVLKGESSTPPEGVLDEMSGRDGEFGAPRHAAPVSKGTPRSSAHQDASEPFYLFESQKTDYTSFTLGEEEVRMFWLNPGEEVSTVASLDEFSVFQHERRAVMIAHKAGRFKLSMVDEFGALKREVDVQVTVDAFPVPDDALRVLLKVGEEQELNTPNIIQVFSAVEPEHVSVKRDKRKWRVRGADRGLTLLLVLTDRGDVAKVWVNVV